MRLLASNGELVWGRCNSANKCQYCGKLKAIENTTLLGLDAVEGFAPTLFGVLTQPSPAPEQKRYYKSRALVRAALKADWPEVEIAWLLEFTTGEGRSSQGLRRPHWNMLIKGVPTSDLEHARAAINGVWCQRESASEDAQYLEPIEDVEAAIRYIAAHFQKESQRPPAGWTGHRFTATRGYLWQRTPDAREAAKLQLAYERSLWRLREVMPEADDELLRDQAEQEVTERASLTWTMLHGQHRAEREASAPPRISRALSALTAERR